MVNSLVPLIFYETPSKILQSYKEKSCLDNCILRMKFFKNLTSEKTAKLFNILTGLGLKKCSKLKYACTENKIWRNNRKQLSNRHHLRQNSNLDIFFLLTLYYTNFRSYVQIGFRSSTFTCCIKCICIDDVFEYLLVHWPPPLAAKRGSFFWKP